HVVILRGRMFYVTRGLALVVLQQGARRIGAVVHLAGAEGEALMRSAERTVAALQLAVAFVRRLLGRIGDRAADSAVALFVRRGDAGIHGDTAEFAERDR